MSSPLPHTPRPRGRPRGRPPGSKNKHPRTAPPATHHGRGRPRRHRDYDDEDVIKADDITFDDEDDEGEEDEDEDDSGAEGRPRRKRRRQSLKREENSTSNSTENDNNTDEPKEVREDPRVAAARKARAARMRNMQMRTTANAQTVAPLDLDGNPQTIKDDEILVPNLEIGDTKVDEFGHLAGGREYRCRTFTIQGKGERLYMLSTEPARCIGFRDSYLFFQRHRQLLKVIIDEKQKYDLIERNLIPHSYKGRAIGVVTARSVFREFGARIIVGGKKITDDYNEEKARAEGAVEGELADPDDKLPPPGIEYNRNQYVAWHGASAVYHTQQAGGQPLQDSVGALRDPLKKKNIVITDENWMLEHARAASNYNSSLALQRRKTWGEKGVYEAHTGIYMFPQASQPTKCWWEYVSPRPLQKKAV
ncbi:chromatin remodelling complex Rsc7/Swp82 subunit-domain-containing protein [Kockiozyma suomiensis]|uniref:chromatin remodelling complex Rsc7/Swp82 subunit-domain-containing protein n=1 Tax=Kockiozyma suomiensis TaxID=1337062 RepID=UPI003342F48E